MTDGASLTRATIQTNLANSLMDAALIDFNDQCEAANWPEAEKARLRVVSHMEAYLDGLMTVHKLTGQM